MPQVRLVHAVGHSYGVEGEEGDPRMIKLRLQKLPVGLVLRIEPHEPEVVDQAVHVVGCGRFDRPLPLVRPRFPAEESAEGIPNAPEIARYQPLSRVDLPR